MPPPQHPKSVGGDPATGPSNDAKSDHEQPSPNDGQWWYATLPDWIMAIFTIVLTVLAIAQWKAALRTNELTTAIERAFIFGESVNLTQMLPGRPILFEVPVKNSGRATAHITRFIGGPTVIDAGQTPRPIDVNTVTSGHMSLFIGAEQSHIFEVGFPSPTESGIQALKDGKAVFWLLCHLEYVDDVSPFTTTTGFARLLKPKRGEFIVMNSGDGALNYLTKTKRRSRPSK